MAQKHKTLFLSDYNYINSLDKHLKADKQIQIFDEQSCCRLIEQITHRYHGRTREATYSTQQIELCLLTRFNFAYFRNCNHLRKSAPKHAGSTTPKTYKLLHFRRPEIVIIPHVAKPTLHHRPIDATSISKCTDYTLRQPSLSVERLNKFMALRVEFKQNNVCSAV